MTSIGWRGARASTLATVMVFVAAGAALAQGGTGDGDASDETDSPERSELVETVEVERKTIPTQNTIATKLPVPLDETPANVGIVDRERFEQQHAFSVSDAVENVAGVQIQTQNGITDFFTVRGFDSLSGTLVMIDGAREPEATFYPLYNVEKVEVFKGPAGFLYGTDPLAGAINIVRKQPLPVDLLDVEIGGGSFGTYEASVDWNWGAGDAPVDVRVNGIYRETDRYRDGLEGEFQAINPSVRFDLAEGHAIVANFEIGTSIYTPDAGIPLVDVEVVDDTAPANAPPVFESRLAPVDRKTGYGSSFDFSEQDFLRAQVDYEGRLTESVEIRNKLYYRELDWNSIGTIFNGVFTLPVPDPVTMQPVDTAFVSRSLTSLVDEQRFVGNQLEVVWTVSTGPVRHNVLAGVELASYVDDFVLLASADPNPMSTNPTGVDPIPLLNPVETTTELPDFFEFSTLDPTQTIPSIGETESTVVAPYVVNELEILDTYRVLAGVRYDNVEFEDTVNGISETDGELSPMVGFSVEPIDDLSFYASYSESVAPASPRAATVDGRRPEPEDSTQVEVGLKYGLFDGRGRLTVSLYELEREGIGIPDDNGFTQQVGDQRSRGIEVELAGEPVDGLQTYLSYAYTDAELTSFTERVVVGRDMFGFPIRDTVDRSGNTPAFVPENLLSAWATCDFGGGFGVGGGFRYFSRQYVAADNRYEIDDALVANVTLSYEWRGLRTSLNLRNLFDEEYEVRGFGSSSVIPADPFAAYLRVGYRF